MIEEQGVGGVGIETGPEDTSILGEGDCRGAGRATVSGNMSPNVFPLSWLRILSAWPLPPPPSAQVNSAPARGPDHFPFQGFRDSGIGSQGIRNSLAMMVKTKSTVINLEKESYTVG